MKKVCKRTVWQAVNSEHGERLVQITQEHTRLARELIVERYRLSEQETEIYKARIEQLRIERENILLQFVQTEAESDENP